jgi:hypothetical protein
MAYQNMHRTRTRTRTMNVADAQRTRTHLVPEHVADACRDCRRVMQCNERCHVGHCVHLRRVCTRGGMVRRWAAALGGSFLANFRARPEKFGSCTIARVRALPTLGQGMGVKVGRGWCQHDRRHCRAKHCCARSHSVARPGEQKLRRWMLWTHAHMLSRRPRARRMSACSVS